MHFLLKFLATVAAVYLTVNLVSGIEVTGGWTTLLFVSLAWSVIVVVIKPVLGILTLPITILTLGLSALILNVLLFWGMELIVPGFEILGLWPAILGSIVLSLFTWLIERVF